MSEEPLVLGEKDGAVGIARLNRPDARNALSPETMAELAAMVEAWDADPTVVKANVDLLWSGLDDASLARLRGAMDNAAGVATMLETARAFAGSGQRPKA